jgi:hypothetical protein
VHLDLPHLGQAKRSVFSNSSSCEDDADSGVNTAHDSVNQSTVVSQIEVRKSMSYYTFLRNIYFITITNFVFDTLFLQISSEISVVFIADAANSNVVPMAALEDGDAFFLKFKSRR